MIRAIKIIIIFLFFSVLFSHCDYNKIPLPVEKSDVTSFGANDTSYIEIRPVWDSQTLGIDLNQPSDIIEGPDGYLWCANSGKQQIIALKKSGEVIHENNFGNISPVQNITAISLDSKLNLFITNNSNTIYIWNEYLNIIGIQEVAFKGVFKRTNGDTVQYPIEQTEKFRQTSTDSLTFEFYSYTSEISEIQKVVTVRPFYKSPMEQRQYYGISAGAYGSDEVYVSETFENRIARFRLAPQAKIRLKNGEEFLSYQGKFDRNVVTYGTGAGTVDTPRGIYVDNSGNLYLTQWGGNFLVQKLLAGTFLSQYELYKHPIMDLNRFVQPTDITLDDKNNILIVDRELKKIFRFGNSAQGAGREMFLGKKGLATAVFKKPCGILFADDVVYITDAEANEIRRFKVSISDTDIPVVPGGNNPG